MEKILVSACLIGEKVRYDAKDKKIGDDQFEHWLSEGRLISICPEMAGGLPTPRPPAEIIDGKVVAKTGVDVTAEFKRGAELSLALCRQHQIKMAILKAKSPSCGNTEIYDGSYSGKTIPGAGVTAELLMKNGIRVFNEDEILQAAQFLSQLNSKAHA